MLIDRLENVPAHTGTDALPEQVTFARILDAVETLKGSPSVSFIGVALVAASSSSSVVVPPASPAVPIIAHFREYLVAN